MIFEPYYDFETGCAPYPYGCKTPAMSGRPSSTIASEKRGKSQSREAFIDAISEVPPTPAGKENILRLSRGQQGRRA